MELELKKLYHFVAKESMKDRIEKFSKYMKLDFSKTMRLIVDTMMPFLDNYVFFEEESSDFGYIEFGAEVDIRFYIDPNVYRKLKNAHGVMHSFSIAVMVRKMIEWFFKLIELKSYKWLVENMKRCMKRIINVLSKTGRILKDTENMIHMFGEEQMEEQISIIFSKNYTVLGVEMTKKRLVFKNKT